MLGLLVTVPAGEAELASDRLWALGVQAIEERASAANAATVELWTSLGGDADDVAAAVRGFPPQWGWQVVDIDDSAVESWRDHAEPTWITDDLVLVPAWHDPPSAAAAGRAESTTIVQIDPGAAFGLGDHPTTIATARLLRSIQRPDACVLDVGCGSGVLSVLAAMGGARRVRAIDIASAAVDATVANAALNAVEQRVEVDTTHLADIDESFEIVLANLLAPTIIELADDLRRVTKRDGLLAVSGLLADRTAHVRAALEPMTVVDEVRVEAWTALLLRH